MKFINLETPYSREKLLRLLSDNDFVSSGVKFDEKLGRPMMHLNEKKDGSIRMTCELTGRPTKDDSFFMLGTYFKARITETESGTVLKGYIVTAPIYHLVWLGLVVLFILQCIRLGGFSIVPIFLVALNFIMFSNEYKKQGLIDRYIMRALRRAAEEKRF